MNEEDLQYKGIKDLDEKLVPHFEDSLLMQDNEDFKQVSVGRLRDAIASSINTSVSGLTPANIAVLEHAISLANLGLSVVNEEICMEE